MKKSNLAVFCDFDGTIARRDVGYNMFHHFSGGRNDALLPGWMSGELSTRDCLRLEAEMVRVEPDEFFAYIDQFDLDPGFADLERLCRENETPLMVISEGLDTYIKRLLTVNGLGHLPVVCNVGHFENGGLRIEFPYTNRSCTRCGSCKGERIAEIRHTLPPETQIVFVGDGYSDACAAAEADILFAKKDLVDYCVKRKIMYNEFSNFHDVTGMLKNHSYKVTRDSQEKE
ncbi:MAG: MtnX-like HAD-IB family phosphatase [candidate division Zixibacteria bacterium]|nr:MtnX-like HAD-IB family phosphatase [candidate division Zixibacteria bacterium]